MCGLKSKLLFRVPSKTWIMVVQTDKGAHREIWDRGRNYRHLFRLIFLSVI